MQVEIHDNATPAASAPTAPAPPPGAVQVSDGRVLTLRKIGPLERMRLFKALGPKLSANQEYLGLAMLAFSCASIDGTPVAPPATEGEVEFLVQTLGDAGMDAIGAAQIAAMGITDEDMEQAGGDVALAVEIAGRRKKAATVAAAKN